MCGIAGICGHQGDPNSQREVVERMTAALVHRGPDAVGLYQDKGVALGFRRLAIIDLDTGNQPLAAADPRVVGMLNGEIYNYQELQAELEGRGYTFATRSDTEVMLNAYLEYGADFVQHLRGMFAIALWDGRVQRLLLARDRLGKKPLFYAISNGTLAFASELTALCHWPQLSNNLNRTALSHYLSLLCVPAPHSMLAGAQKLPPAHIATFAQGDGNLRTTRYWRAQVQAETKLSLGEHSERLRATINDAVRLRLRADVPVGVFLSGGIDSTVVAGIAASNQPGLRSFCVGFDDPRFDESAGAEKTAQGAGLSHTTERIAPCSLSPEDLLSILTFADEPMGDSSFVPTSQVASMARKHVTVALSGDGGDELFGGYSIYRAFETLSALARAPAPLLRIAARVGAGAGAVLSRLGAPAAHRLWQLHKATAAAALPRSHWSAQLLSYFPDIDKESLLAPPWQPVTPGERTDTFLAEHFNSLNATDPLSRFMLLGLETTMVDDILVKVDRASMASSLEVRCPLLDHKVVEAAMTIPMRLKRHRGATKLILKHACHDVLPTHVLAGKKRGFEFSFGNWFTSGVWRDFLCDVLSADNLARHQIFDVNNALQLRDALINDPDARSLPYSAYQLRHRVWLMLVFQLWLDRLHRRPWGSALPRSRVSVVHARREA